MDNFNNIISIVREAMPLVQSGIPALVGGFVTAMFLRGNTKRTEFEKIKVGKIKEVLDDLVESRELTLTELVKCKNILEIAKIADEEYTKQNKYNNHNNSYEEPKNEFNFDWFLRFFEAAGNVSSEDMQTIWARLLVSEVTRPKSVHPAFIEIFKQFSKDDAVLFEHYFTRMYDEKQQIIRYYIFDIYRYMLGSKDEKYLCYTLFVPKKYRPSNTTYDETSLSLYNLFLLNIIEFEDFNITLKEEHEIIDEFKKYNKHLYTNGKNPLFAYGEKIEINQKYIKLSKIGEKFVKCTLSE